MPITMMEIIAHLRAFGSMKKPIKNPIIISITAIVTNVPVEISIPHIILSPIQNRFVVIYIFVGFDGRNVNRLLLDCYGGCGSREGQKAEGDAGLSNRLIFLSGVVPPLSLMGNYVNRPLSVDSCMVLLTSGSISGVRPDRIYGLRDGFLSLSEACIIRHSYE